MEDTLFSTIEKNNLEEFNMLLSNGANPNERNEDANTPLHFAAYYNNIDAVKLLLISSVDINVENNRGITPLYYAMDSENFEIAKLIWEYYEMQKNNNKSFYNKIVETLCSIGVDVNLPRGYAMSGFFQKNSPLKSNHHPKAREIGEELNKKGGIELMLDIHKQVQKEIGKKAGHDLSACWHNIGNWMH